MQNMPYEEQIKSLTKISKAIASDVYLEDILRLIVTVTAEMMDSMPLPKEYFCTACFTGKIPSQSFLPPI